MKKSKFVFVTFFSLLFAVSMLFASFAEPVWAEGSGDGSAPDKKAFMLKARSSGEEEKETSVHADPATFEKNFDLSWEQKESTIKKCEEIVSRVIRPEMSDLEKYYTLAIEANKIVEYDWQFWNGGYDFDYYSHQWDSYGALNETSVCVGIAIFYSQLCHAADLPCWFARVEPDSLDHTISYIPNINGNAYYVDVTENKFLMSEKSNPYGPMDKAFSHITKDCTNTTFDHIDPDDGRYLPTDIKECYNITYQDWFREYALHEGTTKNFPTPYAEAGSGLPANEEGSYHASYHDYRSNFTEHPGVWFLDDFYRDPASAEAMIRNKRFDDQLLNVSGVKKNYDYTSVEELEANIVNDISGDISSVKYFPSMDNGKIVAESDVLTNGEDYQVTYTGYDDAAKTAEITLTGIGDYSGTPDKPNTYRMQIKINSAVVSRDPVPRKGLVYTGKQQALIEPGKAECGEMQYALGTEDGPTEAFSPDIPTAEDAGHYYVWYKAAGDADHESSEPVCMKRAARIAPIKVTITVNDEIKIRVGETAAISPRVSAKVQAKFTYESMDEKVATVDSNGVVTGAGGGFTFICVRAVLKDPNYKASDNAGVNVEVEPEAERIDISETKIRFDKSAFTYNGKVQKPAIRTIKGWRLKAGTDYTAVWSNAASKNAGTYKVTAKGKGKYIGSTDATYTIAKAANPMTLKAKTVKVKRKALKKKAKSIARTKAFTVSKAKGKLSYKLVSVKKGKKNFRKKFKVNAKTGKITVKKGLKKGTYKVKVKVRANGNANYKASAWKTVTFKVRVK